MIKEHWLAAVLWTLIVYWQPTSGGFGGGGAQSSRVLRASLQGEGKGARGTRRRRPRHPLLSPPPWLFGVAWTLLYGLMSAAITVYWNDRDAGALSDAETRTLVLILSNVVLNKVWTPVFVSGRRLAALIVLLGIVATSVWLHVEWACQESTGVSQGLWAPYTAWTVYATVLNVSLL